MVGRDEKVGMSMGWIRIFSRAGAQAGQLLENTYSYTLCSDQLGTAFPPI
jgi:hypothetical protein